jgi:peptidoglycan/xylan/chitin deacetylase (PgdA/CDA1 family)
MIFLTFDIEEFDCPLPYSQTLTFEEQMSISIHGTVRILDLLQKKGIKATFFCTAIFAINASDIIKRIIKEGHEVASHGYLHGSFETKHLKESKDVLEEMIGEEVIGFRMANMKPVDPLAVLEAGYKYNSSLNPTFLPGNYNNLDQPRRIFFEKGVCQIPASVTPWVRMPLFWLSLHNLPMKLYKWLCLKTIEKDGYINLYLHPWEFEDLTKPDIDLPWYIVRNSGEKLINRLEILIEYFQQRKLPFGTLKECLTLFPEK